MHGCNKCNKRIVDEGVRMAHLRCTKHSCTLWGRRVMLKWRHTRLRKAQRLHAQDAWTTYVEDCRQEHALADRLKSKWKDIRLLGLPKRRPTNNSSTPRYARHKDGEKSSKRDFAVSIYISRNASRTRVGASHSIKAFHGGNSIQGHSIVSSKSHNARNHQSVETRATSHATKRNRCNATHFTLWGRHGSLFQNKLLPLQRMLWKELFPISRQRHTHFSSSLLQKT